MDIGGDSYVDTKSITTSGNKISFFVKAPHEFEDYEITLKRAKARAGYSIMRFTSHCGARKQSLNSAIFYNNDGTVVDSFDSKKPAIKDLIPDSVGEYYYEIICYKPTKKK